MQIYQTGMNSINIIHNSETEENILEGSLNDSCSFSNPTSFENSFIPVNKIMKVKKDKDGDIDMNTTIAAKRPKKLKQNIFEIKKKKRNVWTKEEDEILFNSGDFFKKGKWMFASMLLNYKKSPKQCYYRFGRIKINYRKGKWTDEENSKLKALYQIHGKKWNIIAKEMGNRSNKQIRNHFMDYLAEHIDSNKFSHEEDQKLMEIYRQHGMNRKIYLERIPNRSFRKIRNRIIYILKKTTSTN